MLTSTLALKATVTKRQAAEPVHSDMAERLEQLKHQQAAKNAATTAVEASTAIELAKSGKALKREQHALQAAFLTGNLGKPVTVATLNGVMLTGKLRQFDQYCLLLEGPDGLNSLIFKSALTTIIPASDVPGEQRQSEQAGV